MTTCRLCRKSETELVIDFGKQPISKSTRSDLYPVELMKCKGCGFLQLDKCIDSKTLYSDHQTNFSSWKNQPHIPRLLEIIDKLPGIKGTDHVLEIGSNDGSFLNELANRKFRYLTGIDPCEPKFENKRIKYHREYFNASVAMMLEKSDLIIARHILEHIEDLHNFGIALRSICKIGTYLLIEVPDFSFFLQTGDYSGVWEEHVNYFTIFTLKRYLSQFGIEIIYTQGFDYSGRSLLAVCRYTSCGICEEKDGIFNVITYQNNWLQYCIRLHKRLSKIDKDIVLYGAGCRGISLINYTKTARYFSFVVDDQPEKQNKTLPVSRLSVFSSESMYDGMTNTCLLAVNTENEQTVVDKHKRFSGQIFSLLHPSKMLLNI